MKKYLLFFLIFLAVFLPVAVLAAPEDKASSGEVFEARVEKILDEKREIGDDGSTAIQQNLKLKGLTGDFKDREFEYYGINSVEVVSGGVYEVGDRVIVNRDQDADGDEVFYVLEKIRRNNIYLLAVLFAGAVLIIGRTKGLRALLALGLSFLVIIKFIVPKILAGASPVAVSAMGCFFILLFIIYITEGVNRKSHLAVVAIFFCLILVFALSDFFINLLDLTGTTQEEVAFLISAGRANIDFRGLLLAAMLIGALGILDDVVISQIEAVGQIRKANAGLSAGRVFKMAMEIGNAHLGAVINTLFLAYAGASFTLLMLFSLKQAPFLSFSQVISNEVVATEIARTLAGCIGLALAIPLSTLVACWFYHPANDK